MQPAIFSPIPLRGQKAAWLACLQILFGLTAQTGATEISYPLLTSVAARHSITAGGNSSSPLFTEDGRHLIFFSEANNLVTNDDQMMHLDVFERDLLSGVTTLVSANRSGSGGGSASSSRASYSANGQIVAFVSRATNLYPFVPFPSVEAYVRDLAASTTILARTNEAGQSAGPRGSTYPLLSSDGRYVAFLAIPPSGRPITQVFRRDLQSGEFTLISANSNGVGGTADSQLMSISADAKKIAFVSNSTNLAPSAGGRNYEVWVRDITSQTTIWASAAVSNSLPGVDYFCQRATLSADGTHVIFGVNPGSGPLRLFRFDLQSGELVLIAAATSSSTWPSFSPNGRYVAYSDATNVYRWDGVAGTKLIVNVNSNGTASANGRSFSPELNADASKVVFLSDSTDLTAQETHGQVQVFVRDLEAAETRLVSVTLDGSGVTTSDLLPIQPVISPDGSRIAWDTSDSNVVPGDFNQASDVFLYSLAAERMN